MGARFEACIFDLDGVLVDTARFHFIAWREMAEGLGIPFHEKDNELLKGLSRIDSLETILSLGQLVLDPVTKLQLMEQKNARYLDLVQGMTAEDVLPGVTAFFAELDAAGIRKGVGSASKNAPEILRRIGLLESLDVVVDGSQVTLYPSPILRFFSKGHTGWG